MKGRVLAIPQAPHELQPQLGHTEPAAFFQNHEGFFQVIFVSFMVKRIFFFFFKGLLNANYIYWKMISTIRQVLFINTLKPQPMQCFGAIGLDIFPIF